jgi:hypothetical protein
MRIDNLNDNADEESQDGNGGGGNGDLNAALSSTGDGEFYVGEDKKSAGAAAARSSLVLVVLVALGGAGLYLMHLKSGPKTAAAAVESQQASKTISSFLAGGETNIKLMEKMLSDTQKVVERFMNYPNANQVPLDDLRTNPFRFLMAAGEQPNASDLVSRKRKEEERQAALKAVQTLQLQSVMSGSSNRSCMINNTLYREGQIVEGFLIEKISSGKVIVKQGVYRFELRIQR